MKTKQIRQINFSREVDSDDTIWEVYGLSLEGNISSEERFSKILRSVLFHSKDLNSRVIKDINPIEMVTNKITIQNWFFLNMLKLNKDSNGIFNDLFINPENFYVSFVGSPLIGRKTPTFIYDEFEFNKKLNKFVEKKYLQYDYIKVLG